MRTGKPSPFEVRGGIGGHVHYCEGPSDAELEYEMASGDAELIIYADGCRWNAPEPRNMERNEILGLVQRLADALPGRIEIHFRKELVSVDPQHAA